jgi:hypothetical protein
MGKYYGTRSVPSGGRTEKQNGAKKETFIGKKRSFCVENFYFN